MNNAFRLGFFLIFLLVSINVVSAQFIFGDIFVSDKGDATFFLDSDVAIEIEGITFENGDLQGTTKTLTDKSGKIWTFSLDLGFYETILIDLHLPVSLESIKSLEGVGGAIDIDNKVVTLVGDDEELDFIIRYEIGD